MADLDRIYAERFDPREVEAKTRIWRPIAAYLQRWVDASAPVLDVACDIGYFIRHIRSVERWASDLRDVSEALPPGVRFIQANGLELLDRLPNAHFGTVFMSNYLEHLGSSSDVVEQLRVARCLLRPGGRVIVLQPNIRLVGAAYWDFIDHRVPLTEHSLEEAAATAGLRTVVRITRFLPYTTKGRLPASPELVRAYLRVPFAWRFLGKQTLWVGESA